MDCKTARTLLEFDRDRAPELEGGDAEALRLHLGDCPECGPLARMEREADRRLAQAMQAVTPAADFHDRLRRRLDASRWAWYRRRFRDIAAAAAILVAVSWGYAVWVQRTRPVVDVDEVAAANEWRGDDIPEQVEQWLREQHGIRTSVPRDLNYAFLRSVSVQELKGRLVPQLLFVRGEQEFAEVLILSGSAFNLPESLARPRGGSGGITVEIKPGPQDARGNPTTAYLFRYGGGGLDWLILQKQSGPAT